MSDSMNTSQEKPIYSWDLESISGLPVGECVIVRDDDVFKLIKYKNALVNKILGDAASVEKAMKDFLAVAQSF